MKIKQLLGISLAALLFMTSVPYPVYAADSGDNGVLEEMEENPSDAYFEADMAGQASGAEEPDVYVTGEPSETEEAEEYVTAEPSVAEEAEEYVTAEPSVAEEADEYVTAEPSVAEEADEYVTAEPSVAEEADEYVTAKPSVAEEAEENNIEETEADMADEMPEAEEDKTEEVIEDITGTEDVQEPEGSLIDKDDSGELAEDAADETPAGDSFASEVNDDSEDNAETEDGQQIDFSEEEGPAEDVSSDSMNDGEFEEWSATASVLEEGVPASINYHYRNFEQACYRISIPSDGTYIFYSTGSEAFRDTPVTGTLYTEDGLECGRSSHYDGRNFNIYEKCSAGEIYYLEVSNICSWSQQEGIIQVQFVKLPDEGFNRISSVNTYYPGSSILLNPDTVNQYQIEYQVNYDSFTDYEAGEAVHFKKSDDSASITVDDSGLVTAVSTEDYSNKVIIYSGTEGSVDYHEWASIDFSVDDESVFRIQLDTNGGSWISDYFARTYKNGILEQSGSWINFPYDYNKQYSVVVKDGYSFAGWAEDQEGSSPIDDYSYEVSGNTTLYAVWDALPVITFDLDGGEWIYNDDAEEYGNGYTAELDDWFWLPGTSYTPVRKSGFEFLGWSDRKGGTPFEDDTYTVTGSATLYAVWKEPDNYVRFDLQGGEWNGSYAASVYGNGFAEEDGYEMLLPDQWDVKREGYLFLGWMDAPDGGTLLDDTYTLHGHTTLYASWKKYPVVTYNLNEGNWASEMYSDTYGGDNIPSWNSNTKEFTIWLPDNASVAKEGSVFLGWAVRPDGELLDNTQSLAIEEDTAIYAIWKNMDEVEPEQGTCGDHASWVLDFATKTLTISGTGEMSANYSGIWDEYSNGGFIKHIVIEDGITAIGDYFMDSASVSDVSIPESVTDIGYAAFRGCISLTEIIIPQGVTVIEDQAFAGCSSLENVTISDSLANCYTSAFSGTPWLDSLFDGDFLVMEGKLLSYKGSEEEITIPAGVTRIENKAFYNCETLKKVVIPEGVTSIGASAFSGGLTIDLPLSVTLLGANAFGGSVRQYNIYSGNYTINYSGTKEQWYAIQKEYYQRLRNGGRYYFDEYFFENIHCADGTIYAMGCCGDGGNNATWELDAEGSLVISGSGKMNDDYIYRKDLGPDYGSAAPWLLISQSDIKNVTIEDGITSIGKFAFSHCENLTEITAPESVIRVGSCAFGSCTSLTYAEFPSAIYVGTQSFSGCTGLIETPVITGYTGRGESDCFQNCTSLERVNLSSNLEEVTDYMFYGCTSLKSIIIPDGITTIGESAFSGCGSLTEIEIPASLRYISEDAFYDCSSLKDVHYAGTESDWEEINIEGGNECLVNAKNPIQSIKNAVVTGLSTKSYTGKAITQSPIVKIGDKTLKAGTDYTVSYKNNTNAGTATVTFTGKGRYNGTKTATFKINKAGQSIAVKASASSAAVGKTVTVSVSGARGTKSFKSSDTTIATVDKSTGKVTAKKVGTVKITATSAATGNYNAASKTITIKIVPAATASITAENQVKGIKLTWKKVTGANGYHVYRGSTKIKTITSGSTVTFTDTAANTNGTKYIYKIVAKGSTGNSTLSKSLTTYRVAQPAVKTLKNSASRKMTVTWGKNAKSNGYQIQYSTNSGFKSDNKSVTLSGASTISRVIGSLAKGKTYYVRIRSYKTVGSAKYWSLWSAAKSVKISK